MSDCKQELNDIVARKMTWLFLFLAFGFGFSMVLLRALDMIDEGINQGRLVLLFALLFVTLISLFMACRLGMKEDRIRAERDRDIIDLVNFVDKYKK